MKKKGLMFSLAFLLSLPIVFADAMQTLSNVWQKILSIGTLEFIGVSGIVPLSRILLGFLVFTIIFAVLDMLGGRRSDPQERRALGFFSRKQRMIVAAIVAIITAIFLPVEVILAIGSGWATAVALLLIGGPVFGLGYLILEFPGKDEEETKGTVLIKFVLCLLVFWILSAVKSHIGGLS